MMDRVFFIVVVHWHDILVQYLIFLSSFSSSSHVSLASRVMEDRWPSPPPSTTTRNSLNGGGSGGGDVGWTDEEEVMLAELGKTDARRHHRRPEEATTTMSSQYCSDSDWKRSSR